MKNQLWYGDNLDVLREHIPDESVDLVYLDPPFNSDRTYNVLFADRSGEDSAVNAQIEAFDDTWTWSLEAEQQYQEIITGGLPNRVADTVQALRIVLGDSDLLAYLVMMAPRLVELRRVLKESGSIYLHCDPTASHYLKVLLDTVFTAERFSSEIIWKRTSAHHRVRRWGPVHDVILMYTKGEKWTWNPQYMPYSKEYIESDYRRIEEGTGRRYRISDLTSSRPGNRNRFRGQLPPGGRYWGYSIETLEQFASEGRIVYSAEGYPQYKRYLDEMPGQLVQDVWTDIGPINNRSKERLGYPTQKPVALLERIVAASSNEGDVILDPFCGCGTTVDAAERLGRRWIGIDITYIAVDLIQKRIKDAHGADALERVEVNGIPKDVPGARALFERNPFDFERWAVSLVYGQPNEKQVGDKGIDGVIRFPLDRKDMGGRALVSVKGGRSPGPSAVRDLAGAVEAQGAAMGVLITLAEPTKAMREATTAAGTYEWPYTGTKFPKIQMLTVDELLNGARVEMPPPLMPYVQAQRVTPLPGQEELDLFRQTGG